LEYGRIEKPEDNDYRTRIQFKDPRTGEEFEFCHAMDDLCIRQLTAINLREMLVRWVSGLSFAEVRRFVPNRNGILTVDHFVTHFQWLEGNHVNTLSLYADMQIQRQNESTLNLPVQNTIPQRRFGQPLTEIDISSDSSSSSSSFELSIRRIPFGSSPTHNTTVTQSTQGDSEEVASTSVQPEYSTRNEVQEIEDTFLSSTISSTIIRVIVQRLHQLLCSLNI